MRIVSLLPSATEIVYALGLEPVAVSHECDYPPPAAEKPSVNRSRIDPDAGSAEIHEQVARAERDHGGVYEIDLDALREADPDLIITQAVCDVCAVDRVLVEEAVERLDLDARILTIDPHGLADILDDVRRIGRATDAEARAETVVSGLRERIGRVEREAASTESRPRTAVFDWMDPVMVAGHWIPEMVELAGGSYGMAAPADRSTPREWAEVLEYDPEVVAIAPCGFDLDQAVRNVDDLRDRDGWETLAAVREDRVYAIDGHHYVNRPGPRMVDTLELLAGIVHPELFDRPPEDAVRRLRTATFA